ncbi:alpha/beta fold hydrolase [Deinococcus multiflagellatus]|uniref:Alpha/beta fold hydrolase n=1 Tax=Deinococcus multiflagellatus TaxID=1656887 RepID=A0ABW1ZFY8_9DEIO|nr:alpha/beta fold hydrolase [Deinococcus multiflagellatus]MBZ9711768.1 alpha/beta hydrolase [Deinococcus multiflagellatus]
MSRPAFAGDPHATPMTGGVPYTIERRVLAGVPCLVERPPDGQSVRALCVVYHGAWATKEGKLGVYSALTAAGAAIVLPDSALHGERQDDTPPGLNAREYVWESVRRTVAEAPALLDAAQAIYGAVPVWVVGSSMGGYVAQTLGRTEPRVARVAALITSGVWHEPDVRVPALRAFLDAHRPLTHAGDLAPTPLLLASGEADATFALAAHHEPTAQAYRAAYAQARHPEHVQARTYPGVGHYTSRRMRDDVVAFLLG